MLGEKKKQTKTPEEDSKELRMILRDIATCNEVEPVRLGTEY